MNILPISTNFNSTRRTSKVQKQPSFKSTLFITQEAEALMRFQALEASRGSQEQYKNMMLGFGYFMEDLNKKLKNVKPFDKVVTVDINPLLKEYMSKPVASRGSYTKDQLSICLGIPHMQKEYTYYPFTYRPGDYGLADRLCGYVKNLLNER